MKCPKCETTLKTAQVRGVEVDRCPQCRGIWFDENELPGLVDLTKQELRALQTSKVDEALNRKRGHCPRDGEELLRVYSPKNHDVVIDTCVKCSGIWLDDGELAKLVSS